MAATQNNGGYAKPPWQDVEKLLTDKGVPEALISAYAQFVATLHPTDEALQLLAFAGDRAASDYVAEMRKGTRPGILRAEGCLIGAFGLLSPEERQQLLAGSLDSVVDTLVKRCAQNFAAAAANSKSQYRGEN